MLAAWAGAIQIIDAVLIVIGAVIFVAGGVWLLAGRHRHNPLAQFSPPTDAPPLAIPVGVVFVYFMLVYLIIDFFTTAEERDSAATMGSAAFVKIQSIDATAKFICSCAMAYLLYAFPVRWAHVVRLSPVRFVGALIASLLAITALTMLQLQAGEIVWDWLYPEAAPPVHPVLQNLNANAWGTAGTVMFVIAAVVIAPLSEELLFRGLLAPSLWRATGSAWTAAVISGVMFGMIHSQPQDIIPLVTMGVFLAVLRFVTGSVTFCVLIHALFNARTIIAALIAPELLTQK